jgi:prefoldin subunit 5
LTINEIVALASVIVSIGTNVALYTHLSAVMNSRFESVDRHFESLERRSDVMLGKVVEIDNRLTRVEERMGIRP